MQNNMTDAQEKMYLAQLEDDRNIMLSVVNNDVFKPFHPSNKTKLDKVLKMRKAKK